MKLIKMSGKAGAVTAVSMVLPLIGISIFLIYIEDVASWMRAELLLAVMIYLLSVVFLVGTSVLPTHILALAGGWVFGFRCGFGLMMAGIISASLLGYWLSLRISGGSGPEAYSDSRNYKLVKQVVDGSFWRSLTIISLMRLSPVIPFAATNVILASVRVNVRAFAWGTLAGMVPRTALVAWMGSQLTDLSQRGENSRAGMVIGLVATVALLILISWLAKKALKRLTAEEEARMAH